VDCFVVPPRKDAFAEVYTNHQKSVIASGAKQSSIYLGRKFKRKRIVANTKTKSHEDTKFFRLVVFFEKGVIFVVSKNLILT